MLHMESYYVNNIMDFINKYPSAGKWCDLLLNVFSRYGVEDYYRHRRYVKDYPAILFRTGEKQHLANDRTSENICVMQDPKFGASNGHYVALKFDQNRSELFDMYMQYQTMVFGFQSKFRKKRMDQEIMKRLRFFNMAADPEDSDSEIVENTVHVMKTIKKSEINVIPLLAVIHHDEDYPHVHFLYMLDSTMTLGRKELQKIPHIEKIMNLNIKDKFFHNT